MFIKFQSQNCNKVYEVFLLCRSHMRHSIISHRLILLKLVRSIHRISFCKYKHTCTHSYSPPIPQFPHELWHRKIFSLSLIIFFFFTQYVLSLFTNIQRISLVFLQLTSIPLCGWGSRTAPGPDHVNELMNVSVWGNPCQWCWCGRILAVCVSLVINETKHLFMFPCNFFFSSMNLVSQAVPSLLFLPGFLRRLCTLAPLLQKNFS